MAAPTIVTLKGVIRNATGPVAGKLVFTRDTALYPTDPTDGSFPIPEKIVRVVGTDGVMDQALYSGNDPNSSPTGWTWNVRPFFPHWVTAFDILVPYDAAGGEVKFNHLAPVPPDGDGALYALANHTHAGGGGGGDISPGIVVAQTSYGASSTSGTSDDYSRANHTHGTVPTPTASQISDATAVGRTLLTAANVAAQRTALGLGGAALLNVGLTSGDVAAGDRPALVLAAATAADVTTLAAATAAATTLANAALASATAADVTVLASATAAATTLANAALASATAADASHVAASDPHTNYASIYYWNGSAYAIVTAANVYVGGTGPVSPTNGDLVFTT